MHKFLVTTKVINNKMVSNDGAIPQFYVHISLAKIQSMVGKLDMFLNYVLAYSIKCMISIQ